MIAHFTRHSYPLWLIKHCVSNSQPDPNDGSRWTPFHPQPHVIGYVGISRQRYLRLTAWTANFFPLFSKGQMGSGATASSRLCPARKDRAGAGDTVVPEPGTQRVPTATPWLWVLQWHCPSSAASCPLLGPSPGKSKRTFGSCQHSTSARYLILAGGKEQRNLFPIPQGQQQTTECAGTKRGDKKKCRIRDFTVFTTISRLLLEAAVQSATLCASATEQCRVKHRAEHVLHITALLWGALFPGCRVQLMAGMHSSTPLCADGTDCNVIVLALLPSLSSPCF